MPDVLFQTGEEGWLDASSLPDRPLERWNVQQFLPHARTVKRDVPVIFGGGSSGAKEKESEVRLPVDILGSIFFMLSRYEELVTPQTDEHDRVVARGSLAFKEAFLDRPIVDEYVEVLWAAMLKMWPRLEDRRKVRKFRMSVSCDVDVPFDATSRSRKLLARRVAGDLVKRRDVKSSAKRVHNYIRVQRSGVEADPNWTFDWLMRECEDADVSCAFYFLTDRRSAEDGDYYWDDPAIPKLMKLIHHRGHEIGLHATYQSMEDEEQVASEFKRLKERCARLGIKQNTWGGRQHFLRWKAPTTWRIWEEVGLDYDSSVAYADHAGFRCGTATSFPVFDIEANKPLSLVERPLVVMECSVFAERYQGMDAPTGLKYIQTLRENCRSVNGDFTVLWHNSELVTCENRSIYRTILSADRTLQ